VDKQAFPSKFCADQLKALSEPLRLQIVDALRHGEKTVGEIAEAVQAEMVTVSHHLGILKHANLVESRRQGRFIVYRLREDLVKSQEGSGQFLDLGCCRIEVPDRPPHDA
jgi:DNA-binding transcriptional ArsR family regulator